MQQEQIIYRPHSVQLISDYGHIPERVTDLFEMVFNHFEKQMEVNTYAKELVYNMNTFSALLQAGLDVGVPLPDFYQKGIRTIRYREATGEEVDFEGVLIQGHAFLGDFFIVVDEMGIIVRIQRLAEEQERRPGGMNQIVCAPPPQPKQTLAIPSSESQVQRHKSIPAELKDYDVEHNEYYDTPEYKRAKRFYRLPYVEASLLALLLDICQKPNKVVQVKIAYMVDLIAVEQKQVTSAIQFLVDQGLVKRHPRQGRYIPYSYSIFDSVFNLLTMPAEDEIVRSVEEV